MKKIFNLKNLLIICSSIAFSFVFFLSVQQVLAQGTFQCVRVSTLDGLGTWVVNDWRCDDGFTYSADLCETACEADPSCTRYAGYEFWPNCVSEEIIVESSWGERCGLVEDTNINRVCEQTPFGHVLECREGYCLVSLGASQLTNGEECFDNSECFGDLECIGSSTCLENSNCSNSQELNLGRCQYPDLPINPCEVNQRAINDAGDSLCLCNGSLIIDENDICVLPAAPSQVVPPTISAPTENSSDTGVPPVTNATFDEFNPLKRANRAEGSDADPEKLSTPGGIISRILVFAFPLAGLILLVMIAWGGFEILYGASTSKAMEAGRQRVTAALIGFFLLFASYWIIQILEVVFGIGILK